jgi:hypothetical protein
MCHTFLAFYIGINPNRQTKKQHYYLRMNIEKIELQCAETLLAYAETMADAYTNQPEDTEATLTALIGRTLELHLNRKINLENLYK